MYFDFCVSIFCDLSHINNRKHNRCRNISICKLHTKYVSRTNVLDAWFHCWLLFCHLQWLHYSTWFHWFYGWWCGPNIAIDQINFIASTVGVISNGHSHRIGYGGRNGGKLRFIWFMSATRIIKKCNKQDSYRRDRKIKFICLVSSVKLHVITYKSATDGILTIILLLLWHYMCVLSANKSKLTFISAVWLMFIAFNKIGM